MWNTILDWAVTVSGAIFLAQIIAMTYRFARTPQTSAGRRQALMSAGTFLSVCLALSLLVAFWHGPVHLNPNPWILLIASSVILVGTMILGGWIRALRPSRLK